MTDPDIKLDAEVETFVQNNKPNSKISEHPLEKKLHAQSMKQADYSHAQIASVLSLPRSTVSTWCSPKLLGERDTDLSDKLRKQNLAKSILAQNVITDYILNKPELMDKSSLVQLAVTQKILREAGQLDADVVDKSTDGVRGRIIDVRSRREETTGEEETLTQRIERLKQ